MKKRELKKVLALVMAAVTVLSASGNVLAANAYEGDVPEMQSTEAAGDVTFGVISDTHVTAFKSTEKARLEKAFKFYSNLGVDALAVVGDLTDSGNTLTEYNTWKSIKDSSLTVPLIASMGNHEGNTAAGFVNATGNKPNDNKVVNGYHFITVSPGTGTLDEETGTGSSQGGGNYTYAVEWLKRQLEEAVKEDPEKPVFVFFHHPIRNTFYVSNEWYGSGLEEVFQDYPQVVAFSGHIHSPNNMPTSLWQDGGYTTVNTATLSYMEMETGMIYGSVPPDAGQLAQGLIVTVNGTKVEIQNYDFLADKEVPQTWVFDIKDVKSGNAPYTEKRKELSEAPVFPENAGVRVNKITDTTAEINFDQAKVSENSVGDLVHSYRYDFVNTKTGKVDRTFKTWSDYYLTPMPDTITQVADGLASGTEYEVRLYAINAYQKTSEDYISAIFKTTGEAAKDPTDPSFEEMQNGIAKADLIDVDFSEGKISDHSEQAHTFSGSDGSNIKYDDTLGKYVAEFKASSSEAFKTDWSADQYTKTNDGFTIETTFKLEKFSGSYVNLFGNMESAGIGFEIYPNSGNSEKADLSFWAHLGGSYKTPRVNGVLNYGEWYHAAAVYDGSSVALYLNGVKIASAAASGNVKTPAAASRYYVIGGDTGSNGSVQSPFSGKMSTARMYSEPFSATQVYMLANRELPALDTKAPIIQIEQEPAKEGTVGQVFEIPMAKYADNSSYVEGNVVVTDAEGTEAEVIRNEDGSCTFIPAKEGTYTITYRAADKAGNEASKEFTVVVAPGTGKVTYTVNVINGTMADGTAKGEFEYNTKLTVTADDIEGKKFAGWKAGETVVSTNEKYTFFVGSDITVTAVYEAVEIKAAALLQNISLTDNAADAEKSDVRYLAQLVIPKGYKLKQAGLVWSSNEITKLALGGDAKVTNINAISNTWQFSVTIKGMPEGRFIRGKIFAVVADAKGNEAIVYSEEGRAGAQPVSITVGTFNIKANAKKVKNLAQLALDNGVELAGLQEVDKNTGRSGKTDMLKNFSEVGYPSCYFSKAINYDGGEYGIGTASKYALKESSTTQLESEENEQRVYQRSVLEKDGRQIAFYNTHLSWEDMGLRKRQMETLKEAIKADQTEYIVVTGDFNADQNRDEFNVFLDELDMVNGRDGVWYDTFTGVDPTMKVNSVDNILVSKNLKIDDIRMIEAADSDHNLLIAKLIFI